MTNTRESFDASEITIWIAGDVIAKSIAIFDVDLIVMISFKKLRYRARRPAIEPHIIAYQ